MPARAAATSRTCCIELVEAKPSPHTATEPAIKAQMPALNAQQRMCKAERSTTSRQAR
jgi:hypothetical protein